MFIGKGNYVCLTKQFLSGTDCFLRSFALRFFVMINENVLVCSLLLAVSNSLGPSVVFFFISVTSQSKRAVTPFDPFLNVPG